MGPRGVLAEWGNRHLGQAKRMVTAAAKCKRCGERAFGAFLVGGRLWRSHFVINLLIRCGRVRGRRCESLRVIHVVKYVMRLFRGIGT